MCNDQHVYNVQKNKEEATVAKKGIYTHPEGQTPSAIPASASCQISRDRIYLCFKERDQYADQLQNLSRKPQRLTAAQYFLLWRLASFIKCLIYSGKSSKMPSQTSIMAQLNFLIVSFLELSIGQPD